MEYTSHLYNTERIAKRCGLDEPIHIEQGIAYGNHCYRGPKPPFNWNHRYKITVYALDIELQLSHDARKNDLLNAIDNHILAEGALLAKYQRKHK